MCGLNGQNQLGFKPSASLLLMFLGEVHKNIRALINCINICYVYSSLLISSTSCGKLIGDKTNVVILSLVIRKQSLHDFLGQTTSICQS